MASEGCKDRVRRQANCSGIGGEERPMLPYHVVHLPTVFYRPLMEGNQVTYRAVYPFYLSLGR